MPVCQALARVEWNNYAQDGSWMNTCLIPTANPSPASLAVATCDALAVVISTSHVWNLIRTDVEFLANRLSI